MIATRTNASVAWWRVVVRWVWRCLLMAGVASGLYWFATRIGEWPREIAMYWAAAVQTLSLLLVWLVFRRRETPVVAVPKRYPLIPPEAACRTRWQFSIRSLLVAMTVVALVTAVIRRDGWPPVYLIATLGAAFMLFSVIAWLVSRLPTWAGASGFLGLCLFVIIFLIGAYSRSSRTAASIAELLEPHGPPWHSANFIPISVLISACLLTGAAVGWAMSAAEQRA